MTKNMVMEIKLPASIIKKTKWYVASCPALGISSQGNTEKKAKNNLVEALSLFFISCIERNTLDAVLNECGFKKATIYPATPKSPKIVKEDYVSVPLNLLYAKSEINQCHV
jgi:predicted RNase H-like HicB family nuclease